jgi:hypothetical protein
MEMRRSGRKLKNYVNEIEKYCTAIQFEVVDPIVARDLYSMKFSRQWMKIEPYVTAIRRKYNGNKDILGRFEKTVNEWSPSLMIEQKQKYGDPKI